MKLLINIFLLLLGTSVVSTQNYEDKRCKCICPSPASVLNSSLGTERKLFIANVPPNKCNCDGVILPSLKDEIKDREQEYCLRCDCKYETRNTTVIMIVVIGIVWVITLLFVYLAFLMCLDPLIKRKKVKPYTEVGTDEARNLLTNAEED